jgi:transcriptional regulator with XRE-family HTH domain
MKDITVLFGQRLKEIREQKGLSQERLAALAGLNRTYISKIERGERNVSLQTAARLADALGVAVSSMLDKGS